jgi:hypothetical protein
MTQVVKVDFKGPKSVAPLVALDALSTAAQSMVDVRGRIRKFIEAEPHTLGGADKCLAELQALKPFEQHLTELAIQMESGLLRATTEQIQEQLTLLLGVRSPVSRGWRVGTYEPTCSASAYFTARR